MIKKFIENNCHIKLIIRLCHVTDCRSLKKLVDKENIYIRYYTSRNFHSKLYIFGNSIAYVGSSNFTDGGMISNQEINVGITPDDNRFDNLVELFNDYWNYAEVLTHDVLDNFLEIQSKYKKDLEKIERQMENDIADKMDDINFPNVIRYTDKKRKTQENIFISSFLKRYQIFLQRYKLLEQIYLSTGKIKFNNNIPLRLEIDQFLSWIREEKAKSEKYLNVRKKEDRVLKKRVPTFIESFIKRKSNYKWLYQNYNKIQSSLAYTLELKDKLQC